MTIPPPPSFFLFPPFFPPVVGNISRLPSISRKDPQIKKKSLKLNNNESVTSQEIVLFFLFFLK